MLKWDNLQHLKNSSKLFTPKNSSEADLISNKYDIKGPIWTDFVRVNPLSFYRKVLLILSKVHADNGFDKTKKSSSRKEYFIQQEPEFPSSDHETFWNDVGMTEFGKLKNGIQYWIETFLLTNEAFIMKGTL